MAGLDNLKYLIEALRGGPNGPGQAAADQAGLRSTYNPQGNDVPIGGQHLPIPLGGGSSPGELPNDPEYMKYLKTTKNPMPYMDWVQRGG